MRLQYHAGRLRYVRVDGIEVLRHIYMGVRDQHWNTIPARITEERVQVTPDGFLIEFNAEHREGAVNFRWRGRFRGSGDRVEAEFDGMAHSAFLRNRIGWCVLHPIKECSGQMCTIDHDDGSIEVGRFPVDVAPRQPFLEIRAVTYQPVPGLTIRVAFDGDIFEMEDQRNWTDDSFKTYSTPLRLPFPVELRTGDTVQQRVTLTVSQRPVIRLCDERLPFPSVGLLEIEDPRFSHVRVDARKPLPDGSVPLEVAVHVSERADLQRAKDAVGSRRVARWLIYDTDKPATTAETLQAAREVLGQNVPIGAGTDFNFAELNRNRDAISMADFVTFSSNPQSHNDDAHTIIENLPAIASAIRAAGKISGGKPVTVSPITWKRRFNHHRPAELEPDDFQQEQPIAAAWLVGVLKHAAEAGAASITLSGYTGRTVLEKLANFSPDHVQVTECSRPLEAIAVALRRGAERCILVANLTDTPREVEVEGRLLNLEPWGVAEA